MSQREIMRRRRQREQALELITEREFAELRNCSVRTLMREREQGSGCPYVKFGRFVRYRYADVVAFLDARRVGVAAQPAEVA